MNVVTQIASFSRGIFSSADGFGDAAHSSCATFVARQALQLRHIDPLQDHRQFAGPQFQRPSGALGARQLENALSISACTSTQNAELSVTPTRLVRVTHPFHPLSGQSFVCVGERYNRYGRRLLLQVDEMTICSVPRQWTDLVPLTRRPLSAGDAPCSASQTCWRWRGF